MNELPVPYEHGEKTFFNILESATKVPMVRINRNDFLRRELSKHCRIEQVEEAIKKNPASAGIQISTVNRIADGCIRYESNKVTAISFVSGLPGGIAVLGTVPADLTQYFGHVLRILQKLVYLYGWSDMFDEDGEINDDTKSLIVLFLGVMFGVKTASSLTTKFSGVLSNYALKKIPQKKVADLGIYQIVQKIAKTLGVRMSKEIYGRSLAKIVPLAGGFISGMFTYTSYKPMAQKLKNHLMNFDCANPLFYKK